MDELTRHTAAVSETCGHCTCLDNLIGHAACGDPCLLGICCVFSSATASHFHIHAFLPTCLQLSDKEVGRIVSRLESLESRLHSHPLWSSQTLLPGLVALQHKHSLAAAAKQAKKDLKAAQVRACSGSICQACSIAESLRVHLVNTACCWAHDDCTTQACHQALGPAASCLIHISAGLCRVWCYKMS